MWNKKQLKKLNLAEVILAYLKKFKWVILSHWSSITVLLKQTRPPHTLCIFNRGDLFSLRNEGDSKSNVELFTVSRQIFDSRRKRLLLCCSCARTAAICVELQVTSRSRQGASEMLACMFLCARGPMLSHSCSRSSAQLGRIYKQRREEREEPQADRRRLLESIPIYERLQVAIWQLSSGAIVGGKRLSVGWCVGHEEYYFVWSSEKNNNHILHVCVKSQYLWSHDKLRVTVNEWKHESVKSSSQRVISMCVCV